MEGSFWFVRNIALLAAICGIALGAGEIVDWPVAWTMTLIFALVARTADAWMRRAQRRHHRATILSFQKAAARSRIEREAHDARAAEERAA